jgi:LysR family transcriptional activator of nhaA
MQRSLNYQHLFYFWMVAREGRMSDAAKLLRLSSATLSVQIRLLEEHYEQKLFRRSGRTLELTDVGRNVFRYAESIFSIGRELEDYLSGRPTSGPLRVEVGVAPVLPKLVTWKLLEPIRDLDTPCHLVCHEASADRLVDDLLLHHVDVILSDGPIRSRRSARLFHHRLFDTPVCIMGTREHAEAMTANFPESMDGAPILLPTAGTAMRRNLDGWLAGLQVRPRVVAEFDDSALLKVAGSHGDGIFPVPQVVAQEAARRYGVVELGVAEGFVEEYFAVSADRQIAHPAVKAIADNWSGRGRAAT